MDVIRPGTKVSLPQAEIINAVVLQVNIGASDKVMYEVAWWNSADRKQEWVEAFEVSADVHELLPVGFIVPRKAE